MFTYNISNLNIKFSQKCDYQYHPIVHVKVHLFGTTPMIICKLKFQKTFQLQSCQFTSAYNKNNEIFYRYDNFFDTKRRPSNDFDVI